MAQRVRRSWLDQFALRSDAENPFVQVVTAAQTMVAVAADRGGLTRSRYEAAVDVEHQARVVEDLARWLDEDVAAQARRCDEATSGTDRDVETQARALAQGLTAAVRAHATLLDSCQTLLGLAEELLVIDRPASRLRLLAAVETVRTAASTAHLTVLVNLPRITDVTLYDRLAARAEAFDTTLADATRVAASLRSRVAVRQTFPAPRVARR